MNLAAMRPAHGWARVLRPIGQRAQKALSQPLKYEMGASQKARRKSRRETERVLSRAEVMRLARLTSSSLDALVKMRAFPAPLPPLYSTWNAAEVDAWLQQRGAAGDTE
jgi:predicted DNA-binding transcriptional regulator AlpA